MYQLKMSQEIANSEWEESQKLLQRMIDRKKYSMLRILQLQEKITSIDKMVDAYSNLWDGMYEKFNILCNFQQNIILQESLSKPPDFPPYTTNQQSISTVTSEDILRNSMITTIHTPIAYPRITAETRDDTGGSSYRILWDYYQPLRRSIKSVLKEKEKYQSELESEYKEMEKYKHFFGELVPKSSNQLYCGICHEVDKKYTTFVPCGHLSCTDCSIQLINCHICRARIKNRHPIFL
jgi:hypothetical protein